MAPKVPEVIVCASEVDLHHELARIQTSLAVEETEESWDALSNALLRLTALCKGGACDHPSFLISGLRSMSRSITSAASSERSRLSAAAMECISIVASGLGGDFEPLVPLFLPTLLALCSRPNKVFVSRSKATIRTVIEQTQLPSVLPILVDALKDKSVSMRLIAVESICSCLNCLNPPDLEKESRARDIEKAIRQTATDASGDIRKISRNVFDAYKILLPNRVESFTSPMSPIMRKYLNIAAAASTSSASNSRPPSVQSNLSSRPSSRPASALAAAAKKSDPVPRPATSLAHGRSASTSTMPSTVAPSYNKGSGTATLSRSLPGAALNSRRHAEVKKPDVISRKTAMGPPPIVPQRRPQVTNQTSTSSTGATERIPTRAGPQRILRGPAAPAATVGRPTIAARPLTGPPPAPGRVEGSQPEGRMATSARPAGAVASGQPMTIKEKLMGNVRRAPLPPHTSEVEKTSSNRKPPDSLTSDPVAGPSVRPRSTSKPAPAKKLVAAPAAAPPSIPLSSSDLVKLSKRGGVNQPTLSQLARMKASEETKKGALKPAPTKLPAPKPLLIRAKTGSGAPSSFKPSSRSKLASTDAVVEVAAAVPLPPSPHSTPEPSLVALPPSPVETPQDIDEIPTSEQKNDGHSDALDPTPPELVVSASVATPVKDDATSATSAFQDVGKTPISALVSSIQRGFLFTPNSPLSPPQSYAVPAPGEGGPWTFTAWPRGMGAFGQMLPAIQDEPSFEGVIDSSSPKRSADESGDFCRPALVDMN